MYLITMAKSNILYQCYWQMLASSWQHLILASHKRKDNLLYIGKNIFFYIYILQRELKSPFSVYVGELMNFSKKDEEKDKQTYAQHENNSVNIITRYIISFYSSKSAILLVLQFVIIPDRLIDNTFQHFETNCDNMVIRCILVFSNHGYFMIRWYYVVSRFFGDNFHSLKGFYFLCLRCCCYGEECRKLMVKFN